MKRLFIILAVMAGFVSAELNAARPVVKPGVEVLRDGGFKELQGKRVGLVTNPSGVDRCGDFLPGMEYFLKFKEFGGEIVTVGSDAHRCDRVGQYSHKACRMLTDVFGHVCTFADRKPVFHSLNEILTEV